MRKSLILFLLALAATSLMAGVPVVRITNQAMIDLPDARVIPSDEDNDAQVTHIYLHYANELTAKAFSFSKNVNDWVTITSVERPTRKYELNRYSCALRPVTPGEPNTIVDLLMSSDSYINTSEDYGYYQVTVLPGLAFDADGQETDGVSFTFYFGPDAATPLTTISGNEPVLTRRIVDGHLHIYRNDALIVVL